MEIRDNRTPAESMTHSCLVVCTDAFGCGVSIYAWACKPENLEKVEAWVRSRSGGEYVRVVRGKWKPRGVGNAYIYVVNAGHPALKGE